MAILTLLTDSGENDHYVAAIKAKILGLGPDIQIIDITHHIAPCDIAHAAFVLRSIYRDFPKGTVHLIGVHAAGNRGDLFIALQLEDQFFVGADNGFFGLLTDKPLQNLVQLHVDETISTTFPERDVFTPAAVSLLRGVPIQNIGKPLPAIKRMIDRQIKATRKQIAGNIIHVDNFGNLITNIPKDVFETLSKGKAYTIQFGGEKFRKIHSYYHQTDEGECFLLFNSLGLMEIGIYKGNAAELLGLGYDSMVTITFDEVQ